MATLMLTLVSHSDLAPVWTLSLRDLMPPPRDMSLTTDMDIMPMVTTTERGRLRLMPRLTPPSSMEPMATLTVWDTTLAMLDTDTLDTPMPMVVLLPPMLLWDTLWPTPLVA